MVFYEKIRIGFIIQVITFFSLDFLLANFGVIFVNSHVNILYQKNALH